IDLGTVIRTQPAPEPSPAGALDAVVGWGAPRDARSAADGASFVDLAIAPDAIVSVDGWDVAGRDLLAGGVVRDPSGRRSIEVLPAARIPVAVEIVDGTTGDRVPARVRFTAAD